MHRAAPCRNVPVTFTLGRMRILPWFAYAALSLGALSGCGDCENEVAQTIPSPSGGLNAVVFHRECGATVGFNTQISIIPSSRVLTNDSGNAVVVDGTSEPNVQWESDSRLSIRGLGPGRIYRAEERVDGVSIAYGS